MQPNEKMINAAIAAASAFALEMFFVAIYSFSNDGTELHYIARLLGGSLPSGFIQMFTIFIFLYGMLDIRTKNGKLDSEEEVFKRELLPDDDDQATLSLEDIQHLHKKMVDIERKRPSLLTQLIRKATKIYNSSRSVYETTNIISSHVRIMQAESDGQQSLLRYVAWAVPSIGFIGTVIGIALALGQAPLASQSVDGMTKVTNTLEIAFDTTLVALVLDVVFIYCVYQLQERSEKFFSKLEEYMLENFVVRIR